MRGYLQPSGKNLRKRLKDSRGFTLPEVIVVMVIFVVIMMITSTAFKTIVSQVGQQSKSIETEIGSVVGLELFRSDLQNAGYGLPWTIQASPSAAYTEITASDSGMPVSASFWPAGVSPQTFNDAPGAPRAVQSGKTTFNLDSDGKGSQYLVLKSLTVAPGTTQKKWLTVTFGGAGKAWTNWSTAESRRIGNSERIIVVRNTFDGDIPKRELEVDKTNGTFSTVFAGYSTLTLPHSTGGDVGLVTDVFQVYGVDPAANLRMPFNRADYYINTPAKMPPACAPNTGILYKAVVNQGSTSPGYTEMPLLDCAADMQIVYGLGPVGSTEINQHPATLPATAKDIREQLKEIRVYILAHEGKKDMGFTYPSDTINVGEDFGGGIVGRIFNLRTLIGGDWQHYRWKLYTIVVRPKNLIQ
jgi:prepilin-type N-terminal cleavage/methylation domain-containing protein